MYWSLSFSLQRKRCVQTAQTWKLRFWCTFCSQKSLSTVTLLQCWLISFKLYVQNEVGILRYLWPKLSVFSRPFSGYLVTLFENEYFKKTFHMERNLILWKWTCKRNTFLHECTKTRFETEANQNSEMGHSLPSCFHKEMCFAFLRSRYASQLVIDFVWNNRCPSYFANPWTRLKPANKDRYYD